MSSNFATRMLCATAVFLSAFSTFTVQPANAFWTGPYASCESPAVLRAISHKFRIADRNVLHLGLAIDQVYDIHQNSYTPATDEMLIARRYCHGKVAMSDGRARTIWYLIENTQGFAGVGRNVEYCISGLDPWHINGADCDSVR